MSEQAMDFEEQILSSIEKIPTLSSVVSKILELVDDPTSTVEELQTVISLDNAITARILKISNSAFYGQVRRISTISDAVICIGFNTVKSLALSASVIDALPGSDSAYFDVRDFWKHSIAVGLISDMVGQKTNYPQPEECLCAGILHGIGKLIFMQAEPDQFDTVIKTAHEKKMPLQSVERTVFGMTHSKAGAMLMDKWKFPAQLVETIRKYPRPKTSDINPALVSIVHLANYIARKKDLGDPGDVTASLELDPFATHTLQIDNAAVQDFIDATDTQLANYEDLVESMVS